MEKTQTDTQQIEASVEIYRSGFQELDAKRLQSLWDKDYARLIYVPIENAAPLSGWEAIEAYLDEVVTRFRRVHHMSVEGLVVDRLNTDTALAFFAFRFAGEFRNDPQTHNVDGRISLVLRRGETGWRAIHYHESRCGPL